jgi:hypothetical protein
LTEHYQLTSFRGDLARDDMVGSISVSPQSSVTYKLIVKKRTSQTTQLSSTVMDSQDNESSSHFNQATKESADARFGKNNYNYGFDANFHGEAEVGIGTGSADVNVHARGATNEVREDFAQSTESAVDAQVGQTNRSRQMRMVAGTAATQVDEETESSTEKTTSNPSGFPLNIGVFQVKEEFVALLTLVDVEVSFRNGDASQDRMVPLRQLGTLLEAVIDGPDNRKAITRWIKNALEGVCDYQGDMRSILKQDASSRVGLSVNNHLESTYELRKADGTVRRKLSVPGIIIKDFRRFLRKPMVTVELPITSR